MRISLPAFVILLFFNCSDKKPVDIKTRLYYLSKDYHSKTDTVSYASQNITNTVDLYLSQSHFIYNNKSHLIKAFTTDNHAPVDGGKIYYTLDSFGILYGKSSTWFYSIRLQSTNDSLNNLFNHAYNHVLSNEKLSRYTYPPPLKTVKMFDPPIIKEEKNTN